MQGLNFNYDSTYIQNTIQENEKTQGFENSESQVSFMSLVKNEIRSNEQAKTETEFVQTDRDVLKSSYDEAAENTTEVAASDREVSKAEDSKISESNKTDEVKTANDEKIAKASDDKDSESDTDKAKKAAAESTVFAKTFLQKQNKTADAVKKDGIKNAVNAEKVPQEKVSVSSSILNQIKKDFDFESIKEKLNSLNKEDGNAADELFASQMLSNESPKEFLDNLNSLLTKTDDSKNQFKDAKVKKDVKKISDVISVTDLRTQKPEANVSKAKSQLVTSIKQTSSDSVAVTMDLSSQAEKNILSLDAQTAGAQGSTFQAMLENQISENAADFVKAGNIVLKDNDVGKINLILHPESLGNVKISLELSDKVITGKILVSSQEAFNAFNSTQESLKTAFIESGFDGASFDVAFANQNQNFSSSSQNENQNSRQAVNTYSDLVVENYSVGENNSDIINDIQDYSINIVA